MISLRLAEGNTLYNIHCHSCGVICSFADDSTLTVSRRDPAELDQVIDIKYKEVEQYMVANKLVLNSEKTHLLVLATPNQHRRNQEYGITLNTGTEIIRPSYTEKLLGGYITNDFRFNEHLKENEKSAFKSLTSRVNALAKISRLAPFKTRKMVANGIVISKLTYLIQWWGGCPDFLIKYLQALQNRAARIVTNHGPRTPNAVVLGQCGWLSVKQMVQYHSLVLVYEIRSKNKPEYLRNRLNFNFPYRTRLATGLGLRRQENYKYDVTKNSFIARTTTTWNQLPEGIRNSKTVTTFKQKVKLWTKQNIPLD